MNEKGETTVLTQARFNWSAVCYARSMLHSWNQGYLVNVIATQGVGAHPARIVSHTRGVEHTLWGAVAQSPSVRH